MLIKSSNGWKWARVAVYDLNQEHLFQATQKKRRCVLSCCKTHKRSLKCQVGSRDITVCKSSDVAFSEWKWPKDCFFLRHRLFLSFSCLLKTSQQIPIGYAPFPTGLNGYLKVYGDMSEPFLKERTRQTAEENKTTQAFQSIQCSLNSPGRWAFGCVDFRSHYRRQMAL